MRWETGSQPCYTSLRLKALLLPCSGSLLDLRSAVWPGPSLPWKHPVRSLSWKQKDQQEVLATRIGKSSACHIVLFCLPCQKGTLVVSNPNSAPPNACALQIFVLFLFLFVCFPPRGDVSPMLRSFIFMCSGSSRSFLCHCQSSLHVPSHAFLCLCRHGFNKSTLGLFVKDQLMGIALGLVFMPPIILVCVHWTVLRAVLCCPSLTLVCMGTAMLPLSHSSHFFLPTPRG